MVTCISTYLNVYATSFKTVSKAWSGCKVILSEKSKYCLSFQLSFEPNLSLAEGMLVQLGSHVVTRQDTRQSMYDRLKLLQGTAATLSRQHAKCTSSLQVALCK